jgi:hypothetical protein
MSLPQAPTQSAVVNISVSFDPTKLKHPLDWDWDHILTAQHATFRVLHVVDHAISASQLFNLAELHDLIFNNTIDARPKSLLPNDNPILPVRVITASLARRLFELDPEEQFFHLEFFPPHPYADLWSAQAWRESVSRKLKHNKELQAKYAATPLARREAIISELTDALRHRLPTLTASDARKFAIFYLATPASDTILTAFGVNPNLLLAMQKLRDELTPEQLTEESGTADAPADATNAT